MQPGLIVIAGPTACGKSEVALKLAQCLETVILSGDSRQVYRGLDIGTAKPTTKQQAQVPHYLIDICEPTQTLTVAEYQTQAQDLIQHFHSQDQTVLLVGGTGLYLQSITQGLSIPPVPPQPELRAQLSYLGQGEIYQWLQEIDPVASQRIHPHDQVRTLRALEVYYVLGIPLSQLQHQQPPNYPMLFFGLDYQDLGSYSGKIQERVKTMLAQGWLGEIELLVKEYGWELPLLQTLGYQEMGRYLQGQIGLDQAIEATTIHTRQFGKRQRTWFRNRMTLEWFDAADENLLDQLWKRVQEFRRGLG
ncbi:tRNA (adenosine(37)-N6)-dimethylallyltransferase MiaA [Thermosynechococcaceae cyanobacterium BACA0444]|uniref:tRNA dimethylallyltransferase n=1 Tax=Pseudocalidococcus azoricus BACA0444 TaxID=2918990 RepID=A0AAE4FSH7_9CYAN|nr:tRNA (adenosine(37)-N6)-dimethylallyltransferase MiaA [Pseudocalidococcus azoricus]MDS3860978.1 tRNA (adenosine(37)-N6)-dimethylallyltransferase MiaA [Pseudocalidococcus azoricus BACA0444]